MVNKLKWIALLAGVTIFVALASFANIPGTYVLKEGPLVSPGNGIQFLTVLAQPTNAWGFISSVQDDDTDLEYIPDHNQAEQFDAYEHAKTNAKSAVMKLDNDKHIYQFTDPDIDNTAISGSSCGLALGLYYYLQLDDSFKLIEEIALTGTLHADGKVGAILGIKQKIISLKKSNIKHVFVPYHNYEEAKKIEDQFEVGVEVIPIEDLDHLVNKLFELQILEVPFLP